MPGRIRPTGQIQPFDRSNLTSQIRCKSIEITLPVKGHTISMYLHPISPGINYWSNWVEIHCDYTIIQ